MAASIIDRTDRGLLGLAALTFAISLGESSIVPVLPLLRAEHGLSALETGAVLSATTLAMLAVSLPAGLVAARVGPKRVLLAAVALLAVAMLGVGLAPGLAWLLLARAVFGVAAGAVWTIAPVLAAADGRGAGGTGWLIAAAGAGWLVGPVGAGTLAQSAGVGAPFLLLAVVVVPLGLVLAFDRSAEPAFAVGKLRAALGVARRERSIVGATVAIALVGAVTGASGLLAPLVLAGNGLSVRTIGLLFGLSAIVFTVGGALATRLPAARVDGRLVAASVLVLALAWVIPAVSVSTGAIVAFLLVSAASRALLNTIVYALARAAVPHEALAAPVTGMMNAAWAATALAAPVAVGLAVGGVGVRVAFAATAAVGLAAAAWLLVPRSAATPAIA
jgi:predicted MFS family arabinose efflux permease